MGVEQLTVNINYLLDLLDWEAKTSQPEDEQEFLSRFRLEHNKLLWRTQSKCTVLQLEYYWRTELNIEFIITKILKDFRPSVYSQMPNFHLKSELNLLNLGFFVTIQNKSKFQKHFVRMYIRGLVFLVGTWDHSHWISNQKIHNHDQFPIWFQGW